MIIIKWKWNKLNEWFRKRRIINLSNYEINKILLYKYNNIRNVKVWN